IMFRGREITHPDIGERLSLKLTEQLSDISTIEKMPKVEGRNMVTILVPKMEQEKNEKKDKKEEA
ncbi:MAG TPA: translation initiation factor IF-3, partial [Syntrophomonas wolfei]|nr:translation initiation factor IF-3 [Syntrophomonas wolfei]